MAYRRAPAHSVQVGSRMIRSHLQDEITNRKVLLISTTRDLEAVSPHIAPAGTIARDLRSELLEERSVRWEGTALPGVRPLVLFISFIAALAI